MNICGIGTDIVSLQRIKTARYLRRVAEYILRESELALFDAAPDQVQYLGSRFAAKEAVIKACPEKLTYHDFVIDRIGKKPTVTFVSPLASHYQAFLSLAHEFDTVIGFAVLYRL
jgi:holo-[acyl-carrier-protein] synthase